MITREQVAAEAREWLETRWQHQASLKGVATDCIGLVSGVARQLGLPEARKWDASIKYKGYGRTPNPILLREAATEFMLPIQFNQAGLGDVLLMRFDKEPQHFGIISSTAPMLMIHAYAQAREVVENGVDGIWRERVIGAYRLRGVA